MIKINNRRYIGSKTKLVDIILEEVETRTEGPLTFADIFAGTGIVAHTFANNGHNVIINDTLYSNYISYKAWFGFEDVDLNKIQNILHYFNNISYNDIKENYFSKVYGGKYFSINDAKKIGHIRELLEDSKSEYNEREFAVILTSLMYSTDKIANTVGHFEHFLKKKPADKNIELKMLDLDNFQGSLIYQEDANDLIKKISPDVVYIDPPYNARQYVNFYHVLENLANWDKPTEFQGTSMKFKRDHLKSGYSRVAAKGLLKDLISNIDAKLIVLSYNNTYTARSTASNNRITEKDIIEMLESRGNLEIVEIDHKYFNSGKTVFNNHKEKLYICEVNNERTD